METLEVGIQASDYVVFKALVDAVNALKQPGFRLLGVKVSVNPSRYGVDEAWSIQLQTEAGEGEIGKILVVPLDDDRNRLVVPRNHTGGMTFPELDPDGRRFDQVVTFVVKWLAELGLVPVAQILEGKGSPGYQPRKDDHAS